MVQPLYDAYSICKCDYRVAVLALILSPRTGPNVSVYGPDHHFQYQWLDVERCYLIFLHPVVCVSRSVLWFKYGNWCFVPGVSKKVYKVNQAYLEIDNDDY